MVAKMSDYAFRIERIFFFLHLFPRLKIKQKIIMAKCMAFYHRASSVEDWTS